MLEFFCLMAAMGFFANALLHLLLIAGFPLGEYVLGGRHVILPYFMRLISGLFIIIWSGVSICYLNYGGLLSLSGLAHVDKLVIMGATFFYLLQFFRTAFLRIAKKNGSL